MTLEMRTIVLDAQIINYITLKIMKKSIFKFLSILLLGLVCFELQAQTISKQVIGASGQTLTNANLKLAYSIGEPVVGLMSSGSNQLGNGYYPALDLETLSNQDNSLNLQLKVFPNPTTQYLHVTHPNMTSFKIQIADITGKQMYGGSIKKEVPLDISSYTQGTYLITIENTTTNKKNTYKIIKK